MADLHIDYAIFEGFLLLLFLDNLMDHIFFLFITG